LRGVAERKAALDPLAVVALVGCCLLWGLNQVAAKAALPEVPPLWQAALRSVGGTLLVAAWTRLRGVPLFKDELVAHRSGTGPARVRGCAGARVREFEPSAPPPAG